MAIRDCDLGFYQLFFCKNVLNRLMDFEIVFISCFGKGKKIDLETDFYYMILLKREIILSIIIFFKKREFSNHTVLFIILLSEV